MEAIKAGVQWFAAARWRASLFHALWALAMFVALALLLGAWPAAVSVITFFYVREVTQYQYALKGGAPTWTVIHRGWWPGAWVKAPLTGGWYAVAEFVCPAGVVLGLAVSAAAFNPVV